MKGLGLNDPAIKETPQLRRRRTRIGRRADRLAHRHVPGTGGDHLLDIITTDAADGEGRQ